MDTSRARLFSGEKGITLYCPITKIDRRPDGTVWAMGWGTVSDYRDDQNEIVDPEGMRSAVAEWAPWGNIRLQHDAARPIGVCPEGNWEIRPHPETGTDALWLNAHIVEPTAVKMLEEGVLKGFSIGGLCLERTPETVVDDQGIERRAFRLKRFRLSEISLVDKPACDLARVERIEIAKRAQEETVAADARGAQEQPGREGGSLRKFVSRMFGRHDRDAGVRIDEGRLAAVEKGDGGRASGAEAAPPLAKSLGTMAFVASRLDAWRDDIEAMKAAAGALGCEAISEGGRRERAERMVREIEELSRVRDGFARLMAEIAQKEAGQIRTGSEEEDEIIMDAARVLKAINQAASEDESRKAHGERGAASLEHLARCVAHLDKAAHHHGLLGSRLDALHKCRKAAGDEASEHIERAREHHDSIAEHHELARLHLEKARNAEMDGQAGGGHGTEARATTIEEMIASALGAGEVRKDAAAQIVGEMIALIRKNAELEARLAALDQTPARPRARLFAVHKGDEARMLTEQADGRRGGESPDPADRDAFRKSYRQVFANPRSIRDPMFKGSAGGSL
jgi:hypothetical protein